MKRAERQNRSWLLVVGFISSAFLFGCAVGPNYKRPQTLLALLSRTVRPMPPPRMKPRCCVVAGFNDTRLDRLVDRAMTNNHDLRIATANLKEARALRRLATFDLAPTVQANAGYANSSSAKPPRCPARREALVKASFTMPVLTRRGNSICLVASAVLSRPPTRNSVRSKLHVWTCW